MTKSKGALALGLVIVVVAALLAIFNQSRTFPQLMGQSYAPTKVESIHIYLSPMQNGLPARELTLTQEDPAAQDLLALLAARSTTCGMTWAREGATRSFWTTRCT